MALETTTARRRIANVGTAMLIPLGIAFLLPIATAPDAVGDPIFNVGMVVIGWTVGCLYIRFFNTALRDWIAGTLDTSRDR